MRRKLFYTDGLNSYMGYSWLLFNTTLKKLKYRSLVLCLMAVFYIYLVRQTFLSSRIRFLCDWWLSEVCLTWLAEDPPG